MEKIAYQRINKLEEYVINTYLSDINLEDEYDKYDFIVRKVFNGEVDDVFLTNNLDDLSEEEKKEVFKLARDNQELCFFQGNIELWTDSPIGATGNQIREMCKNLLDDYDCLIKLARNGKEVLEFLLKFKNREISKDGSVIAVLKNIFHDYDTLEKIIVEMANKEGEYKDFSEAQKLVLCDNADGVLYKVNNKEVEIVPSKELEEEIVTYYLGTIETDYELGKIISKINLDDFTEKVVDIYTDYYEEYNFKK